MGKDQSRAESALPSVDTQLVAATLTGPVLYWRENLWSGEPVVRRVHTNELLLHGVYYVPGDSNRLLIATDNGLQSGELRPGISFGKRTRVNRHACSHHSEG